MTLRNPKSFGMAVAAFALWGSAAFAGEPAERPAGASPAATVEVSPPDEIAPASQPHLLSQEEMSQARGRATIVLNDQDLTAVTSGNEIGSYVAGTINLSDNALSSFNGVGNFLFNTGAQNSLQTGMTLTITIEN